MPIEDTDTGVVHINEYFDGAFFRSMCNKTFSHYDLPSLDANYHWSKVVNCQECLKRSLHSNESLELANK